MGLGNFALGDLADLDEFVLTELLQDTLVDDLHIELNHLLNPEHFGDLASWRSAAEECNGLPLAEMAMNAVLMRLRLRIRLQQLALLLPLLLRS